VVFIWI